MKAFRELSNHERDRRLIGCLGFAFGFGFLIAGLFLICFGISNGIKQLNTSSWTKVDGKIIKKSLNGITEDNKNYSPVK